MTGIEADLARVLRDGDLIICVGPEPSRAAGLPDMDEVTSAMLEQAVDADPSIDAHSLSEWIEQGRASEVLELLHHHLGADFHHELERRLSDQDRPLPAMVQSITRLHEQLRAIYTTRLDRLIERGLAGRWPSFSGARPDIAQRRDLLFKLFGTIELPHSWVLTHEQIHREFAPGAPRRTILETAFRAHQMLFIGFDAQDHDLRRLLDNIPVHRDGQGPSHFIALPECNAAQRGQFERRGLRVLKVDTQTLLDSLSNSGRDHVTPEAQQRPYPGHESFTEDQAAIFFGRHTEVSEAATLLGGLGQVDNRWLAIEGPSQIGKSSFARAGVVPALQRGFAEGAPSRWRVASMRPGSSPMHNLAQALCEALALEHPEALREQLLANPGHLTRLARIHTRSNEGLLVLVDQLEELLATAPATERAAFCQALTQALEAHEIYLITTARTEQVPALQRGLPSLFGSLDKFGARYPLLPISRAGLREAISAPATAHEITIVPELVERIFTDADECPTQPNDGEARTAEGTLPLVAKLLHELWTSEHVADGVIVLNEYLRSKECYPCANDDHTKISSDAPLPKGRPSTSSHLLVSHTPNALEQPRARRWPR